MNNEISILIADDHPIFRQGLRQVIEKESRLKVVAEADHGDAALELIKRLNPMIVILDLDMPVSDGFAVARAVREQRLSVEIIFLTMHKDEMHFNEAVSLGAKGYVIKDSATADVVNCIKAVANGQNYISPVLSTHLLKRSRRASTLEEKQTVLSDLTPTERRILTLLADLKTSKEIAGELGVSSRTIDNHRANICRKFDLRGSHSLVRFALQHKSELSGY